MATNRVFSREDGSLNQSTLITSRSRLYKDIDLTFAAKPNGELYKKSDAGAVKQAIKNLILTNHFEKPFEPFYGGNIRGLLFELIDDDEIEEDIITNISSNIERYEPRVRILDINVFSRPDYNSVSVRIDFQVISTEEKVSFTTVVSRLR